MAESYDKDDFEQGLDEIWSGIRKLRHGIKQIPENVGTIIPDILGAHLDALTEEYRAMLAAVQRAKGVG
jgi:hypothetical protein